MYTFSGSQFKKHLYLAIVIPSLVVAKELPKENDLALPTLQISEKLEDQPPPNVSSIQKKTLDQRFIRNFEDLAKRAEPGINFNRTNQSINIRGLEKDRVLTTVDGIRLPYLDDRS